MMYVKEIESGKVVKVDQLIGMDLLKAGSHQQITPGEYNSTRNNEPEVTRIGEMTRPIYARVSTPIFDAFRRRVKAEGIAMDEALAGIVTAYANGMVLAHPKAKKIQTGADYGKKD
jgi:hypothetical protein